MMMMDGWIDDDDGWMDRWIDGWMDGWIDDDDGSIDRSIDGWIDG